MSQQYTAEPAPSGIDPVLAEFLMRQFHAIAASTSSTVFSPPVVTEIPERLAEGAIVHLKKLGGSPDNGLWVCLYNEQDQLEWKKVYVQN